MGRTLLLSMGLGTEPLTQVFAMCPRCAPHRVPHRPAATMEGELPQGSLNVGGGAGGEVVAGPPCFGKHPVGSTAVPAPSPTGAPVPGGGALIILWLVPGGGRLLYSGSFRLWVLSFLLISCFLDLTMAELLSVSLLKKAGGWLVLPGDLEPILLQRSDTPGQWAQRLACTPLTMGHSSLDLPQKFRTKLLPHTYSLHLSGTTRLLQPSL